jgi:hypothetical protein
VHLKHHLRMFLWGPSDAERNSCGLPCLVSSWHGQNAPWRLNSCDHKHSRGTPPRTLHPAGTREQSAGTSTPKELSTWSMSDTPGNWVTIKESGNLQVKFFIQISKYLCNKNWQMWPQHVESKRLFQAFDYFVAPIGAILIFSIND